MDFFARSIMDDLINKVVISIEQDTKKWIIENLKKNGFEFPNEVEFLKFCSKRLTKVSSYEGSKLFGWYVDYNTENQILIGTSNENVKIKYIPYGFEFSFGGIDDNTCR